MEPVLDSEVCPTCHGAQWVGQPCTNHHPHPIAPRLTPPLRIPLTENLPYVFVYEFVCVGCGRLFKSLYPHYRVCDACYKINRFL